MTHTDNEIIKALECCTRSGCSDNETKDCPLKPFEDCSTRLASNALDLINRQKAEIERLQSIINMDIAMIGSRGGKSERTKQIIRIRMDEVKSEAIKEFAEELCDGRVSNDPVVIAVRCAVKELTGGRMTVTEYRRRNPDCEYCLHRIPPFRYCRATNQKNK